MLTKEEKEARKLIVFEVERAQKLLIETCETFCKTHGTSEVPLSVLQSFGRVLIDNYKKGASE